MRPDGVDETDGQPFWVCESGQPMLDGVAAGLLAVEQLGVGHRTETWLAWSEPLWHPVVVKLARPHQVDHPRARLTLERESDALATVHPSLPRLLADGLATALPHLVIEYVDGLNLAESLDEHGAISPEQAAVLGAQLLPAITHLHAHGLAHLDVKTENVVVRDGRPLLIDCGSARPIGRLQPAGKPVGTEGYASPELEACEPISAAMDLYGFGTVLAECLTGTAFPEGAPLPDGPLTPLVRTLLSDDPARRGSREAILLALSEVCGPDEPWPAWLDACLARATSPVRTA